MNLKTDSGLAAMNKKELKAYVNANGFFASVELDKNAPSEGVKGVPEGATYFKGIASDGELNRNGYIIRVEAWKKAINGYFKNPAILLQHDAREPVGKMLSAAVTDKGLEVEGYIFDDLTEQRFSRGLINALSTGHLTKAREFENSKTKEILTEEQFFALPWEERMSENWTMAVSALEWVETSLVTIGSNRKSLISAREVQKNYIEAMSKNEHKEKEEEKKKEPVVEEKEEVVAEAQEEVAEEVPAEEVKTENKTDDEKPEVEEEQAKTETEAGEIPAEAESETAENAAEPAVKFVKISENDFSVVKSTINNLLDKCSALQKENVELKAKLSSIPMPKGLINTVGNKEKAAAPKVQKSWLAPILEQNGITPNI